MKEGAIMVNEKHKNKRMKYDPDYHDNHNEPWSKDDLIYLCKMYDSMSKEDLSFALGRTHATILSKAYYLRKKGEFDYYKSLDED